MINRARILPLFAYLYFIVSSESTCEDGKTTKISVSVISSKNLTGHELFQIETFRIPDSDIRREIMPWQLNMEQREKECAGTKSKYVSVTVAGPPVIRDDYEFLPFVGRYKLHMTPEKWGRANSICQQEGAHLAVINSEKEAQFLQSIFKRAPVPEAATYDYDYDLVYDNDHIAFLGVSDIISEGKFVTIFGDELEKTGYAKWGNGEPNKTEGEDKDCVGLHKGTANLADVKCSGKLPFFCEISS